MATLAYSPLFGGIPPVPGLLRIPGSFVIATEIFLWLTRIPRCASSALSTLRTVDFGCTSSLVSRWISSTAPDGAATMRALTTPGRVSSSSSALLIGRTTPAMADESWGLLAGRDNDSSR
jgi:hypothetical protein